MSVSNPPESHSQSVAQSVRSNSGAVSARSSRQSVETEGLFPLPLTPFEELMLNEDTGGYPITFFLQMRVHGVWDESIAALAMSDALHRNPLLACRVERSWRGVSWVWSNEDVPVADLDADRWKSERPWQQEINLTTSTGLRVWGETDGESSELTFQFHHACCDAIGAAQFLEDFAVGYAHYHDNQGNDSAGLPDYREINHDFLRTRNSPKGRRVSNMAGSFLRRTIDITKHTLRYLRMEKLSLVGRTDQKADAPPEDFGLRIVRLSREETRGLRRVARQNQASLGELLMCEMLRTSADWYRTSKNHDPKTKGAMSIQLPVSLRGPNDDQLPACNVIGNVFIERTLAELDSSENLLQSVHNEMTFVHQSQAGWIFLQSLGILRRIPGVVALMERSMSSRCMSTVILSHMGNLLNSIGGRLPKRDGKIAIGNLLIEDVCGIAPFRPGTNVVFSTLILQRQLLIGMRCDRSVFSLDDEQQLLDSFLARLRRTAGGESS